ncbi:MAG: hypothetical protein CO028_01645 [Candidatus Levybacteria bacterium CG_4_9_14_0_2_um_filter_35_21]|nr:MAG: hypothetical protein COW87_01980 [Candidatus Levybacteria bacterium CG22_combo_CG10-13_8_21_14_all_35_11]PJC54574.1 MAG: hypothetical protein CO028_01645 [Candidatus Levybacteria bacterium CG_4_9_14_0_2_um_filter_35_21]
MTFIDYGIEFEDWIRHKLPRQLNLSAAKEQAIMIKFGNFADYVRHIANKDPDAFGVFFCELVKKFEEVSKYKAPHGCVNEPVAFSKWLYDWAPIGTSVYVY